MNTNFKNFISITEIINSQGAIYVPEAFEWAKEIAKTLPAMALDIPTIEKRSRINTIMDKKNPIYIQLDDGSKLFFTLDQFKQISGKPERGKTMVVGMQRLSHDTSELPSQIAYCKII